MPVVHAMQYRLERRRFSQVSTKWRGAISKLLLIVCPLWCRAMSYPVFCPLQMGIRFSAFLYPYRANSVLCGSLAVVGSTMSLPCFA